MFQKLLVSTVQTTVWDSIHVIDYYWCNCVSNQFSSCFTAYHTCGYASRAL